MLAIYQRTVEPSAEPLTIGQLLDFMKAAPQDAALIESLGITAREFVEEQTGRALVTQTWRATFNEWQGETITLDKAPLASVSSVQYYPANGGAIATLSTSVYRVINGGQNRPGFIELIDGQSWPDLVVRSDAIIIEFIAGTVAASVKKQLVQAVALLTKHFYDNGRNPVNIGNIATEVPYTLRDLITSQRVGGWFA